MTKDPNSQVTRPARQALESEQKPFWQQTDHLDAEKPLSLRGPLIASLFAVVIGFGGFLLWGFTADLDSAAVATGKVVVDSQKKTITHLEGGILRRLLVQEGEFVKQRQPLG